MSIKLTPDQITLLEQTATDIWPFEKNRFLAERWVNRWSAREIADAIGVTKNQIIGRAHRLIAFGIIEERPSPIRRHDPSQSPAPARKPAPRKNTLPQLASVQSVIPFEAPAALLPPPLRLAISRDKGARKGVAAALAIRHDRAHVSPFDNSSYRPVRREVAVKPYLSPLSRCAFPLWKDNQRPTQKFCDAPVEVRSYCQEHARRCYVNVRALDRREGTYVDDAGARRMVTWGATVP